MIFAPASAKCPWFWQSDGKPIWDIRFPVPAWQSTRAVPGREHSGFHALGRVPPWASAATDALYRLLPLPFCPHVENFRSSDPEQAMNALLTEQNLNLY